MKLFTLSALFCFVTVFSQKQFTIGIYWPPDLSNSFVPVPGNYHGTGKAEISLKTDGGFWLVNKNTSTVNNDYDNVWDYKGPERGGPTDIPAPADYDGDGITDMAVKTAGGLWIIDYAADGFHGWEITYSGYGDATNHPVPADYDGDGKADLSVKNDVGYWNIDYSHDGYDLSTNGWDYSGTQRGGVTDIPTPADYDGDGIADMAVKTAGGSWLIDYAKNGFNGWDETFTDYGDATNHPVPADYDYDGKADLSIKNDAGYWNIDYSHNGFNGWDYIGAKRGDVTAIPVPADYNGDGYADLAVKTASNLWLIDYCDPANTNNYFGGWEVFNDMNLYTTIDDIGETTEDINAVGQVKDAGINLLITPTIMFTNSFFMQDYYLKIAGMNAMKVTITNHNLYEASDPGLSTADNQKFVNHFKNDISSSLKESIFGVDFKDEPNLTDAANINQWISYLHSNYSEKPLFLNLLPRYGAFQNDTEYQEYLDAYINTNSTDIISFDHYPFESNGNFITSYFYNLSEVKKRITNQSFWAVIPADKDHLFSPIENQLRFLAFSPIAYGVNGITYWPYRQGFKDDSQKYNYIKKINTYLRNNIQPIISTTFNTKTLHKTNTTLNTNYPFSNDELLLNNKQIVKDIDNDNTLVGIFESKITNNTKTIYLWIVNKSIGTSISNLKITLNGYLVDKISIGPRFDTNDNGYTNISNAIYDAVSNSTIFTVSNVLPAEPIIIKINRHEKKLLPDYNGDGIADMAVKTADGRWLIDYYNKNSVDKFDGWEETYTGYGDDTNHPVSADYDGDGKADLSVKNDAGYWNIDYSGDGYDLSTNGWNYSGAQRGGVTDIAAPADYDGDGITDMAVKTAGGSWLIDYAKDGFNGWEETYTGYGDDTNHPVPADYDGDGKADLSIKNDTGYWNIDYSHDGYDLSANGWDYSGSQRGGITSIPAPVDYDGDGITDIAVKTASGIWYIDYAYNGFNGWDENYSGYGDATNHPVPADYDGDGKADLSIKNDAGYWNIDYSQDSYDLAINGWDYTGSQRGGVTDIATPAARNSNNLSGIKQIAINSSNSIVINYYLNNDYSNAKIIIYNSLGRSVSEKDLSPKKGTGNIEFTAEELISGIYYCTLILNKTVTDTKQMLVK
ncbi:MULTISPECIES: FG-GAP repeat domain-containing protein [unclassified Chryseobacterium]|uniref:FG-GAP repeat domain-containing protein n=1 Tax=unclassified Chryseobacterium TaxID=2593645 RepID=UPI0030102DC5